MTVQHNREECPYCRVDVIREQPPFWRKRSIIIITISGVLFVTGIISQIIELSFPIPLILFIGAATIPGYSILKNGISALMEKRLDVNILMTVASIGAFSIGYEAEGAAVLFLFYIAEFLENYAGDRARRSVSELLELSPETATRKSDSRKEEVHIHEIDIGETIIVRPGERIPLDGKVSSGSTSVNQAPVTGESVPVSKGPGEEVFAGSLNKEGYIEVEVTKPPGKTTLSKIIDLVKEAQEKKSKTEGLVNRVSKYYTPAILVLAVLFTVIPVFLFSRPLGSWVYRSLVLLAVSCPCAFVISTPVSMVSSITSAARKGLLIKGGAYIEEISEERILAMDKTRTITEGEPEVGEFIPWNGSKEESLMAAVSLESKTKHPLANAVVEFGRKEGIEPKEVKEFESVPGKGIEGTVNSESFIVGSKGFFEEKEIDYPKEKVEELEKQGKTVILVGRKNKIVALIAMQDKIRKGASETIARLKEKGIKPVMLTGDNERVAKAIAEKVGIEEFYANLLPEEKVEIIRELVRKYEHVSMIGDGVNDAPALAEAHVGIAMGAAGSDVAIETADIVLMEDDLTKVNYLFDLGSKSMKTVKENISLSVAVKGLLAVLAVFGFVTLSVAVGVGDMGISFVVVLNALRLGTVR